RYATVTGVQTCALPILTISIMPSKAVFGNAVRNPALPTIDFSINALQGHTLMQWPHDTQLDSPIGLPPSHRTRGCGSSQRIEREIGRASCRDRVCVSDA